MTFLGLQPSRDVDRAAMEAAVAAANDIVLAYRRDLADAETWPARVEQAATQQAARLYGRRGSVQGVAAFQDVGVSLLPRIDPDVRLALELGEYQPSVVA